MFDLFGFTLLALLAALGTGGLVCGFYLLGQWRKYQNAGKNHNLWRGVWACGWLVVMCAALALLFPATRAGWPLAALLGPPLWVEAYILFRRAKAQDAVPLPRYDDPQEGVWPPPPKNVPK